MVLNFRDVNKDLKSSLDIIQTRVHGRAHSEFFRKEVKILKKAQRFKGGDLETRISKIAADIMALPPVVIQDRDTHRHRDEQVAILRNGLLELGITMPGKDKEAEENAAIQADAEYFQRMAQAEEGEKPYRDIYLFNMLDPAVPPVIPQRILNLTTCSQVKKYLESHYPDGVYDLWARRQGKHLLTERRLSWEHLKKDDGVQGLNLECVDLQPMNFPQYIVVLMHHNEEDLPKPIKIPHPRLDCCGRTPRCRNLREHLEWIWSEFRVLGTVRISNGEDVSSQTYDTHLFDKETNDLCVFVEAK